MNEYVKATLETIYMVIGSGILSVLMGLPLAIFMVLSHPAGLAPKPVPYRILDLTINMFRSFPFVILIILVMPISAILIGRKTGTTAMILPLSISATPFIARVFEQNFLEVNKGKVEAALALGASNREIVRAVYLPEALPALVNSITITLINLVGYSAMAGMLGAGGLGDLAVRYGFYNRQTDKLIIGSVIIILLVQAIQMTGQAIARSIDHRQ